MATQMSKLEINCSTGEETIVPLTADEIVFMNKIKEEADARILAEEEKANALSALKESAKSKLIAGEPLTEEEANTLLF